MACLKRLGTSLFILTCFATCECKAQATFYVFNDTSQGIRFHWSSDILGIDFRTIVANPPAPTVIPNVPTRTSGVTNFIAVAEILSPTRHVPGAKFTAINGQELFIRVEDADPGYRIDVRHANYFRNLLGNDIYEQWVKTLPQKAEKANTLYDAGKKRHEKEEK